MSRKFRTRSWEERPPTATEVMEARPDLPILKLPDLPAIDAIMKDVLRYLEEWMMNQIFSHGVDWYCESEENPQLYYVCEWRAVPIDPEAWIQPCPEGKGATN